MESFSGQIRSVNFLIFSSIRIQSRDTTQDFEGTPKAEDEVTLSLLVTRIRAVLFFLYSMGTSQAHWKAVGQKCGEQEKATESKT